MSFNGAPSSQTGIGGSARRSRGPRRCFNGAPSSQTGIGQVLRLQVSTLGASTGPRLRRRGSPETADLRRADAYASTGPRLRRRGSLRRGSRVDRRCHRFNGAPSSQTGIGGRRWGPRSPASSFNGAPSSQTGIGHHRQDSHRAAGASTGPRLRRRGSVAILREERECDTRASTGPRLRRRGSDPVAGATQANFIALQRGPVFADGDRAAESPAWEVGGFASTGPRLRRRGSAERRRPPRSRRGCFNGAPSSQTGIGRRRAPP